MWIQLERYYLNEIDLSFIHECLNTFVNLSESSLIATKIIALCLINNVILSLFIQIIKKTCNIPLIY